MRSESPRPIPLWLKLACSLFLALWIPVYWQAYGPVNFLWFCDLANFLIILALWLESALLLSSQAVAVLVVQVLWLVDVLARLLLGFHPIGGTEYMFDPARSLPVRLLSLFHVAVPPLLLWGLARLGYHRRGWQLQTAIAWVVLPLSFLLAGPERNLNWVWGLFGRPQAALDPLLFLGVCLVGYPLVLYLPSHWLLARLFRGGRGS